MSLIKESLSKHNFQQIDSNKPQPFTSYYSSQKASLLMTHLRDRKQIFILTSWWKAAPLLANGIIILWALSIYYAVDIFESFSLCARRSTNCDWLIDVMLWVFSAAILWHVLLVLAEKPKWKYLLYGVINGFVLFLAWLYSTVILMVHFRMLS